MRRFGFGVLGFVIGYPVAAVLGYFLILALSPNMYDRSLEAVMTSAFAIGPLGAVIGLVIGLVFGRRKAT